MIASSESEGKKAKGGDGVLAKRKCLRVSNASKNSSRRTNEKDLWFSNWSFVASVIVI